MKVTLTIRRDIFKLKIGDWFQLRKSNKDYILLVIQINEEETYSQNIEVCAIGYIKEKP